MGQGTQINIINGTPYSWTQKSQEVKQMSSWGPPSNITASTSAQVNANRNLTEYIDSSINFYAEWNEALLNNAFLDSANTQYSIDGTSSTFTIQARFDTHGPRVELNLSGMSTMSDAVGSVIDLGFVWNGVAYPQYNNMTIVIAGTDGKFVCNSTSPLNQAWLQQNLAAWGHLNLRQICIPASHDSGMSTIGTSTAFANARNCQTQTNDIAGQLGFGARFFDIRPVISGGEYYTGHYSNTGSSVLNWQGADGQKISDIVNQINSYTQNNAELIVLELSHAYDTDSDYTNFTQVQWNGIFTQFQKLDHLFVAATGTTDLTQLSLNNFIGNGKAAVLLYVDFDNGPLTLGSYAGQGFYYKSQFPLFDSYADTEDPKTLIDDQFGKLQAQRSAANTEVFSLDWNLTLEGADNVTGSISNLANTMNPWLAPTVSQRCTPTVYPNLLSLDNIVDTTALVVATTINDLTATASSNSTAAAAKTSDLAGSGADHDGTATAKKGRAASKFNWRNILARMCSKR